MNWNEEAYRLIRREMVRRKMTYAKLAEKLVAMGVQETPKSIANKVSRGSFSFVFFIQCMRALEVEKVDIV